MEPQHYAEITRSLPAAAGPVLHLSRISGCSSPNLQARIKRYRGAVCQAGAQHRNWWRVMPSTPTRKITFPIGRSLRSEPRIGVPFQSPQLWPMVISARVTRKVTRHF